MSDDSSDLTGEEYAPTILDGAIAYQRWGLKVFPVHAETKQPMPGYGWPEMADGDYMHVIEDFTNAMSLWGTDNVSVAWALGLDGCMAVDIDVDGDHLPDWMPDLVQSAVISITRRGQHLIFRMPTEMKVGNGTAGFPTQGWGEVRGYRGYIVIAGPDRPGLDLGEMDRLATFPRPDYLREYGGGADAVSKDELLAFANAHSSASNVNMLNGVRAALDAYTDDRNGGTKGRHPLAVWAMCEVAAESLAGYYAFKDGFKLVQDWWRSVTPPERHGREWVGICCWAVGRALASASAEDPPTDGADEGESPDLFDSSSIPQLVREAINWDEFWTADNTIAEWLIEGFWPLGKKVGVYAKQSEGKSEWALWCALQIVTGCDPGTGERVGEPMPVLYLDFEMDWDDLRDRLENYGVTKGLDRLTYDQFPSVGGVDTAAGRQAILDAVDYLGCKAVIIDTYGMAIEGPENDADTALKVARDLGNPLKSRGVGMLLIVHPGRDVERGARGSSALAQQMDVMWMLNREQGKPESILSCTGAGRKRRQSWVPNTLRLRRHETDDGIRYERIAEITDQVMTPAITSLVYELEAAGIDWRLTQRETIEALGRSPKTKNLAAAMRHRKEFYTRNPQGRIATGRHLSTGNQELSTAPEDDA